MLEFFLWTTGTLPVSGQAAEEWSRPMAYCGKDVAGGTNRSLLCPVRFGQSAQLFAAGTSCTSRYGRRLVVGLETLCVPDVLVGGNGGENNEWNRNVKTAMKRSNGRAPTYARSAGFRSA